jgi:hypothetical protein
MYQYTTHYVGDDSGAVIGPGPGWLLIQTVSLSPHRVLCIWHKMDEDPIEWGVTVSQEEPVINGYD